MFCPSRSVRALPVLTLFAGALAAGSTGCANKHASNGDGGLSSSLTEQAGPSHLARAGVVAHPFLDGGLDGGVDGAAYAGPWLGAIVFHAPILSEMEWPGDKRRDSDGKSVRLGYMRYGDKVPVFPEAHAKPNCPEGWYELLSGGFMCGKYATLDLDHPRFKLVKPPDLDGPLPYTYGVNMANGTPLYRTVPSRRERMKLEPWLTPRPKKAKLEDDPYASSVAATIASADSGAIGENAGDTDAEAPWWEKESPDGGPTTMTLEDLQETGGPIARRMVKGFYLSLDHQFDAAGTRWWRTVDNLTTPSDRILIPKQGSDFHGVWLGRDDATYATKSDPAHRIDKLPIAFALHGCKRWTLDATRHKATVADGTLDRFDAVGLTGEKARASGYEFWESTDGWWMRAIDGTETEPGPPPSGLGAQEKWIDVNLRTQTLVAFEGATPVYATLVSSGRNEHETPPGSFRIREKHIAATMDGDADTAADGPYSIQDVPYIEYFNGGYALHGAFWHSAFGNVKSHGCVNLAPWDAKNLFGWTDPQLPDGWHAVWATKDRPGTRVVVHERGPGTCTGPEAQPPECPSP